MKITIITGLLLILINRPGKAQFPQGAKDSAQKEILQLTNDWNNAIVDRDSLSLDKILGPEYSLNGIVNREIWMNNTLHHFNTDTLRNINTPVITFYGNAVKCEGSFFWKASYDGKPRVNSDFDVTDIWVKRNGHWQVILRMSLPKAK